MCDVQPVVRIHCGSAHVKGRARQWRYLVASLFVARPRARDGVLIWFNSGFSTAAYRGEGIANRAAAALAARHGATLLPGYGSLHHTPVQS